jgi:hydroxyacylglutathione hydrolase
VSSDVEVETPLTGFVVSFGFLTDNFGYLLVDAASGEVAVIDGADPTRARAHVSLLQSMHAKVAGAAQSPAASTASSALSLHGDEAAFPLGWAQAELHTLRAALSRVRASKLHVGLILATHGHMDHAGGNDELAVAFPGARVVVGTAGRASKPSPPGEEEKVELGGTTLTLVAAPCHTRDSALVFAHPSGTTVSTAPAGTLALFSGDTLFVGGAGKFFEGKGDDFEKIAGILKRAPGHALVFTGHEYSRDQLSFARWLQPDLEAVSTALAWSGESATRLRPVMPTTLDEERSYNPYLRASLPAVREATAAALGRDEEGMSEADILAGIRALKDRKAHAGGGGGVATGPGTTTVGAGAGGGGTKRD